MKLISKFSTKTSNGLISKGWYEHNGIEYLIKGNTVKGLEPYSEVIASRIGYTLGLDTVEYNLVSAYDYPEIEAYNIEHLSICESYLDGNVAQTLSICKYIDSLYTHRVKDYWSAYHNSGLNLYHMYRLMVFDAFIGNEDRHLNNWDIGITENNQIVDMPIIDSGASLLYNKHISELRKQWTIGPDKSKPFKETHDAQIRLIRRMLGKDKILKYIQKDELLDSIWDTNQDIFDILGEERSKYIIKYLDARYVYLEGMM